MALAGNKLEQLRLMIQDDDPNEQMFTDDELNWMLSENDNNVYITRAYVLRIMAQRYTDLEPERARQYIKMAEWLEEKYALPDPGNRRYRGVGVSTLESYTPPSGGDSPATPVDGITDVYSTDGIEATIVGQQLRLSLEDDGIEEDKLSSAVQTKLNAEHPDTDTGITSVQANNGLSESISGRELTLGISDGGIVESKLSTSLRTKINAADTDTGITSVIANDGLSQSITGRQLTMGITDGGIVESKLSTAVKTKLNATDTDTGITSVVANDGLSESISGRELTLGIGNGTITGSKIADATLTGSKLADGTITGAKIAATTITGAKIASDAITSSKINNSAVSEAKLAKAVQDKLNRSAIPHYYKQTFSGLDDNNKDNIADGSIGFYDSSDSQIQTGSLVNSISYIILPQNMAALTTNPTNPSTDLAAVDTSKFFEDRSIGGGRVMLYINQGTDHCFIQFETITKHTHTNGKVYYKLANKTYNLGDLDLTNRSSGIWYRFVADARYSITDIIGLIEAYVQKNELKGSESELYASYNNSFLAVSYRVGLVSFYNQTTNPSNDTNSIGQPDIDTISVNSEFWINESAYLRTDSNPDKFAITAKRTPSDYILDGERYYAINHNRKAFARVQIKSTPVAYGSGNASYLGFKAKMLEVYELGDVQQFGDYFAIDTEEPTKLPIEIPVKDILGLMGFIESEIDAFTGTVSQSMFVVLTDTDGNLIKITLAHLGEHIVPQTTAPRKIALTAKTSLNDINNGNLTVGIQNALGNNGIMQLKMALPATIPLVGGGSIPLTDVEATLNRHHLLELYNSDKSFKIEGIITSFNTAFGEKYVNLEKATQTGSITNNETEELLLQSNLVGREELSEVAYTGKADDVSVAASGFTGNLTTTDDTVQKALVRLDALATDAADISVDASGFDGNLTTTDNTVQKVAQKLDDLSVSGGGGGGSAYFREITATDTNSNGNWTATVSGYTAYSDGDGFVVKAPSNKGLNLKINSLGNEKIQTAEGNYPRGLTIRSGVYYLLIYSETRDGFELINPSNINFEDTYYLRGGGSISTSWNNINPTALTEWNWMEIDGYAIVSSNRYLYSYNIELDGGNTYRLYIPGITTNIYLEVKRNNNIAQIRQVGAADGMYYRRARLYRFEDSA